MRPLISSFFIIILHFPCHMKPVTFHIPFLLFSIIFINKCHFAFPKHFPFPFPISITIINQMNTHVRMFSPTLILDYISHDHGYYFSFINSYYMDFWPRLLQQWRRIIILLEEEQWRIKSKEMLLVEEDNKTKFLH